MHLDERLTPLITEARWHTVASLVVLPLLLVGLVSLAALAFGALEMGLATAQRRSLPAPALVRRLAGSPQAS
ncbi:MAG TPA: hypothetical protein VFC09_08690 [Candidatus Dormibacteraeota bacterium]|nr:hypothetical protein [Candidatus Dormibacteraeota bacterium]